MADEKSVQSDDGTHTAFFYGTLMAPQVFFTVCYGSQTVPEAIRNLHTFTPAILHGFCRRRVKYAVYPGMVEDEGHSTRGMYVTGLTKANIAKLDYFEGSEYERRKVKIKLLDVVGDDKGVGNVEGEEKETETYVFLHRDDLEEKEWDFEEFCADKMKHWTREGHVFDDCDPNNPAKAAV